MSEEKTLPECAVLHIDAEGNYTLTPMDMESFLARGREPNCDCGLIECACLAIRGHTKECRFRFAMTAPVLFECEHGLEMCDVCDACDCGAVAK
jgi:hypothetical protein